MSKLRVNCFGGSVDGFGAGSGQNLENSLEVGGMGLHGWEFPTRMFQQMHGGGGNGMTGIDDDSAARGFAGVGLEFSGERSVASGRTQVFRTLD